MKCRSRALTLTILLAVALLPACAAPPPTPGTAREEVLRRWGPPTNRN